MVDPTPPPGSIGDLPMAMLTAADRPTLGAPAPVAAFRAIRLGAMGGMAGSGLNGAVYLAGRRWAAGLTFASPADLFRTMTELRESLSGSGLPAVGEPLCHFEAGFLAGALAGLTHRRVQVRETACWGTGAQQCLFVAKLEPRS
ncbi:MAG: hypothetical protein M3Z04_22375 [Chloroflexota bacterium]|nr:hypothetical protein [Chloroflexota bacterium]